MIAVNSSIKYALLSRQRGQHSRQGTGRSSPTPASPRWTSSGAWERGCPGPCGALPCVPCLYGEPALRRGKYRAQGEYAGQQHHQQYNDLPGPGVFARKQRNQNAAVFSWAGPVCLLVSALLTAGYLLPISIRAFFPGASYDYSCIKAKEASPDTGSAAHRRSTW